VKQVINTQTYTILHCTILWTFYKTVL